MADSSQGAGADTEVEPASRLRFETYIADLSARLLKVPTAEVRAEIDCGLTGLLDVLEIDRCGLGLFSANQRSLTVEHSASRPGVVDLKGMDFSLTFPWYTEQLRQGRRLVLNFMSDELPPEAEAERDFAVRTGLRSHVVLPVTIGDRIFGALGVASVTRVRVWSSDFLARMELLGSVFGHALYRSQAEESLAAANAELARSLREIEDLRDRLAAENVVLLREVRHLHGFETIVGRSAAIGRVLSQIEQVSSTDSPVLLLGETGTGKDVIARALHDRSRRNERPMVTVNCAALPPTLIESELFGYERGAFTGALQRSVGRFEIADRGTIFLDEIGELPLEVQAKLLRVVESGEFERLGSPRTIRTNARIVAATNRDLEREVREGRFRADLYYRLSVFPVPLPPLRDRPEDIPLLVWHFVALKQARLGRTIERIPDRLMRSLTGYAWPGNVRELENVIERAIILSDGPTLVADPVLFYTGRAGARSPGPGDTLEDVERAHIRSVLVECNWKVAGSGNAADRLGLNRSTLQFRMKKLGIERPAG